MKKVKDYPKDSKMQKRIRSRANMSMAILGKGAVTRASGRFLNIRPSKEK